MPVRLISIIGALALLIGVAGCTTAPLDQNGSATDSATAHLRNGPSTATPTRTDIEPVVTDPMPRLPATVDSAGRGPVTVTDTSRILAVDRNGTLGAIVFSLGLGPHVVGRDTSTAFPSALRLPVVTDRGHALNSEATLALHPTVVLVDEDTTPPQAVDHLRASGIAVVAFDRTRSVESTPPLIRAVAAALGVRDAGEALVRRTVSEIDTARASIPKPSGDPTIAFLYIRGPRLILLAGPGSGADGLITALGGRDAGSAAELTGAFTAVSDEALLKANPDVVLVMTEGAESVGGIEGVLRLPGIADTNAGRARRVVQMEQTQLLAFGPDTGLVLGALAKSIYA